ncbi:LysR family transcriptional regulator [Undibacterium sp. TJN25]|uniref:LysR family transcriptional regulator n=1 Tax=Undibacterium sp. TJN25 TaxID=3413056 RepID=UPI003BF43DB6
MLLEDLKAFVAVMDHHSITRAAAALSLTQSAISRRIQHLEDSLDSSLFDRNSKPPQATPLAHRLYRHALPLLQDAQQLLAIPREDAAPSGVFRFGLTQLVADMALYETLVAMKSAFPKLELRSHTAWSPDLQQQITQGKLDAAALMLPSPASLPEGMAGSFISTLEVLVVQSRQKPLLERSSSVEELAQQQWVLNPLGCGYRAALERAMEGAGRSLKLSVDTHGTEMQLRLVAGGLGLGLVPRSVLRHSASRSRLSIVEVRDFSLKLDIWLVHPMQMGNLKLAATVLADSLLAGVSAYNQPSRREAKK